jgi:hypothetical protein
MWMMWMDLMLGSLDESIIMLYISAPFLHSRHLMLQTRAMPGLSDTSSAIQASMFVTVSMTP